ncbi:MAG: hypothetical protein GXP05_11695 [Alphaproteobacteria bacterium]|nr:hypothetical protein [Alphaproteobacteria bacterium]
MLDFATEDALSQLEPEVFKKEAVFFPSMDYMDYLRCDGVQVAQRIDRFLTLIWDRDQSELVGFRLKGIHNFFLKKLQPSLDLSDEDFVPVRDLFLLALQELGDKTFGDNKGADVIDIAAYKNAQRLAAEDDVHVEIELLKAA